MKTLVITRPDDWHIHLRDGNKLGRTVADAAHQYGRAIVMPNLLPPVTTITQAETYRQAIIRHIPASFDFEPLMTLYLTNHTQPETIKQAAEHPHIYGVKLYPAGATTHSAAGITELKPLYPVFAAMQEHQLPLLIHGEVTYGDVFDRESLFIEEILIPLRKNFPELKIVLEHITTADAVSYVESEHKGLAATITPQHLLFNRNELLVGGLKPDYYCLPILKTEHDRQALLYAATSGNPRFFMGTDSAPHSRNNKYSACGCAGIYSAFSAIELYAEIFADHDALDKLEGFTSFYGADFYGLPRNKTKITLEHTSWTLPTELSFGDETVTPLWAGKELHWKIHGR